MDKQIMIEPCLAVSLNLNKGKDQSKDNEKDTDDDFKSVFQTEIKKYEGSI